MRGAVTFRTFRDVVVPSPDAGSAAGRRSSLTHIRLILTLVSVMRGNSPADPGAIVRYGVVSATSTTGPESPAGSGFAVGSNTEVIGPRTCPLGAAASAMSRLRHGVTTSIRMTFL